MSMWNNPAVQSSSVLLKQIFVKRWEHLLKNFRKWVSKQIEDKSYEAEESLKSMLTKVTNEQENCNWKIASVLMLTMNTSMKHSQLSFITDWLAELDH